MQQVIVQELGRIGYQKAWDYQQALLKEVIAIKLGNRGLADDDPLKKASKHYLLFCEHPSVYTLGRSGSIDHLLLDEQGLAEKEIEFHKINRGGDITFHGLGQIVGYPILDLDCFFTDVHKYVRYIEEAVILTLAEYGIEAGRVEGFTGVWLDDKDGSPKRKICAIGVHLSRWVTMHGFAFNINTDLNYFKYIVPCGIDEQDKEVTSLALELGIKVEMNEVILKLKFHFSRLFDFEIIHDNEKRHSPT